MAVAYEVGERVARRRRRECQISEPIAHPMMASASAAIRQAATMAVLGALVDQHGVDRSRIRAWCAIMGSLSDSISQTRIENYDFLRGAAPGLPAKPD